MDATAFPDMPREPFAHLLQRSCLRRCPCSSAATWCAHEPPGIPHTLRPHVTAVDADHPDSCQEAKYYLIFLHPIPERPLSRGVVDLHANHMAELDDSGHLVTAGPLVERAGGLIVLRAGSAAEAMAIVEEDPLVRGAYQTYELNTWLMSNRQRLSPQLAAEIR
jgi:uncharacterized protein YciI